MKPSRHTARQHSSTQYNRRHNRGIRCNMHSVSFSLLRFFWTSNKHSDSLRQLKRQNERNKRNEGQLNSELILQLGIQHIGALSPNLMLISGIKMEQNFALTCTHGTIQHRRSHTNVDAEIRLETQSHRNTHQAGVGTDSGQNHCQIYPRAESLQRHTHHLYRRSPPETGTESGQAATDTDHQRIPGRNRHHGYYYQIKLYGKH